MKAIIISCTPVAAQAALIPRHGQIVSKITQQRSSVTRTRRSRRDGTIFASTLAWPSSNGITIAEETFSTPPLDRESGGGMMRKTKIVATIGPTSCSRENLFALADAGTNVIRLNMSHGTHASHGEVIDLVREYNCLGRGNLAIMLDTKGPEVRSGDVHEPLELARGDKVTYTIEEGANGVDGRLSVNYDGFVDDVAAGDMILVDGGIMSMEVAEVDGNDVRCFVVDGGTMKSRRHLNIRGKSANLPAITERDWADISFGVSSVVIVNTYYYFFFTLIID